MLKHHQTVCLALAGVLTVPVLTGQEGDLVQRLTATVRSLEEVAGLRERIRLHDGDAVRELLEHAGPVEPPSPERAARLDGLRDEVQRLQSELDRLDTVAVERLVDDPSTTRVSHLQRSEALLGTSALTETPEAPSEPEGYSADAVREARLLLRARRFPEAHARLADQGDSHEVRYYRARALQGLGRDAEALDLFRALAADEQAGEYGRWAEQDARMLEVRLELAGQGGQSR